MSPSDADDGGTAADEPRAPDDLTDPTLVAEARRQGAIEREDADGEPAADPEPAPRPPSEELKSEGTDEDRPADVASPDIPGRPAPPEEEATAEASAAAPAAGAAPVAEAQADPVVPEQPADATTPVSPEPLATAPDDVPTADPGAVAPAVEAATAEEPAPEPEPEPEPEPDEEPTDEVRQALVATLREELGDGVVQVSADADDLWVRVALGSWVQAAEVCRDRLGMSYFGHLSAIDWLPSPVADAEGATGSGQVEGGPIVTGRAGGDTRFQLIARVETPGRSTGLHLKCDLDDDEPSAPTWIGVYAGADWHEREMHEMFGIDFPGHPHLVHIYLPGEFEGHPMRKDFPMLAREVKPWPGIVDVEPMPGEPEGDAEGGDAA